MNWRTKVEHPWLAPLGLAELHAVVFEALDDTGGAGSCVALQIPEASRREIKRGLAMAAELRARVLFICDTERQATEVAALAARRLRRHRRVSYERAAAGEFGPLT